MTKKRSITFKDETQAAMKKLAPAAFGQPLSSIHGAEPKIVNLTVTLTHKAIEEIAKRTLWLNDTELLLLYTAIKNYRKALKAEENLENLRKEGVNVTPGIRDQEAMRTRKHKFLASQFGKGD